MRCSNRPGGPACLQNVRNCRIFAGQIPYDQSLDHSQSISHNEKSSDSDTPGFSSWRLPAAPAARRCGRHGIDLHHPSAAPADNSTDGRFDYGYLATAGERDPHRSTICRIESSPVGFGDDECRGRHHRELFKFPWRKSITHPAAGARRFGSL